MADLKTYTQELFKKAGISEEKTKAILEALGDEAITKAFTEGFVETPKHHSTIDKTVGEYKTKVTAAEAEANRLNEWYNKQAKPVYDQYLGAFESLKKYEELYGPIQTAADRREVRQATGLTQEQLEAALKQRDQAYVGMTKDIAWASSDYIQRFKGDPLDLDAVEKIALEKGMPFRQAYKEMINPKLEEMRSQELEARVKAARDEGYKDAMSKHKLPVESTPREPHPFFEPKEQPKNMTEAQQDAHSKDSFMEAWNNPTEAATA